MSSQTNIRKEDSRSPRRRRFIKTLAAGAAGLMVPAARPLLAQRAPAPAEAAKSGMRYRRLGRTGLSVSEISLGGSPLPDWNLFAALVERGVNYIDTSESYENGNSERQIGRLFRELGRDKALVSTKFHLRPGFSEKSIVAAAEASLRRLQTETIDVLAIHGAEDPAQLDDERVLAAYDRLAQAGKIRFRGISCHANHQAVVGRAVSSGRYDVVQLGYNVFDIDEGQGKVETYGDYLGASRIADLIDAARARDVGVIAMKALRVGGRRQDLGRYRTGATSLFQAMLKWALENRGVASVVTEILSWEQMREDLEAVGSPLSAAERRSLHRHVAENRRGYCHLCGACRAACPERLPLPGIMRSLAYEESYGKRERARAAYARLAAENPLNSCRGCGACEAACPHGVSLRRRVAEAAHLLA